MNRVIPIALALLNASVAIAQTGAALTGYVMSQVERYAVVGAEVVLPDLSRSAMTDANGVFLLTNIPKGEHTVTVRRLGFSASTMKLRFADGDTVRQLFVLGSAQRLDSVLVTAKASNIPGFEERRAKHIGSFITREEMEKAKDKKMSDVLAQLPGLSIQQNSSQSQAYVRSKRGTITIKGANPACFSHIYMDGAAVYNLADGGPRMAFDINSISPTDIEAVEWYSGGASQPMEYRRTGSACGVLVLWTRRTVRAPK